MVCVLSYAKNYIMSMVCVPVSAKNSEKEGILDEK